MTLNFKAPENIVLKPIITVFGIGGAGGNAVNNMLLANLQGTNFVVANTDAQSLDNSPCKNKIQLGVSVTRGLGAGAAPDVGESAAEESMDEIKSYLENSNMVFITAGMGGGTGTGASPVIARIAKEMGILTVAVVTKPFSFEGKRRMVAAEKGLENLKRFVDTLIVIPNQNLFSIARENTTFTEAFKMADNVLHAGVRSITDLMIVPGLINLDFADIKTVMSSMGNAMMGTGEASGENRAIEAAENAIYNPLLDYSNMKGAKGVLINISGGEDMTLFQVDIAANRVREEAGDDANIIFGSTFNPELNGLIRVSVVATGINSKEDEGEAFEDKPINLDNRSFIDILPDNTEIFGNESHEEGSTEEIFEHAMSEETSLDDSVMAPAKNFSETELPKKSLFSKMWESLLQSDKEPERKVERELVISDPTSRKSNIEEIPTFLRNRK